MRQVGNSGIGNSFECLGHRKLTTCKNAFNLSPLVPKSARDVVNNYPNIKMNFNFPIERMRTFGDVAELHDKHYGLPIVSNFPLVDAVIQPHTLIQFTIARNYHKGAVELLPDLRSKLREKDQTKHIMIFVVPEENMNSFKYQKDLKDIKQYIMITDPIVLGKNKNRDVVLDITNEEGENNNSNKSKRKKQSKK
jgi:hypothetical protein